MIYLDNQGGSGHKGAAAASLEYTLKPCLDDLAIPVTMTRLKFGDASLVGNGPDGPVRVGIEIKKVDEFLTSIYTHRLTGYQLPGMFRIYNRVHLLIEGGMRRSDDGKVEVQSKWGGWSEPVQSHDWKAVQGFLLTLQIIGGVILHFSGGREETAATLGVIRYWYRKPTHTSLNIHYYGNTSTRFAEPSPAIRFAEQLDGVGFKRASKVAGAFVSAEGMVAASLKDWQILLGPVIGKRAYDSLRSK